MGLRAELDWRTPADHLRRLSCVGHGLHPGVTYSGGTLRQRVLESLMCGAISLSLMSAMEWIGVPTSASGFIGGMVGFLGVDKLRSAAELFLAKKVGGDGQS